MTGPEASAIGEREVGRDSPKRLAQMALIGFVLACIGLFVIASMMPEDAMEPGYAIDEQARPSPDGTFVLTVNVKDPSAWRYIDLDLGRAINSENGADLVVRRYIIKAPDGAQSLGDEPLLTASLPSAPAWQVDTEIGGEWQNPAFARWYEYGYSSHLLKSKRETYVVGRSPGNGVAFITIESYYCSPEGSGCLTLRYRLED